MKRLIICADGTWNVRDQVEPGTRRRRPTNVTKVARAVVPKVEDALTKELVDQVVIYLEGVGTHGPLDRVTGGAFGSGMEENVRALYRAIAYNWVNGDELFLFGFSRGAFTVRTLAGFMHYVGLLTKGDDYYLPEMYRCYEKGYLRGSREWECAFHNVRENRGCPEIKFIGVWDTVGSRGAPGLVGQIFGRNRYAYHNVGLNPQILNAFQALAIDEHRVPFSPEIWSRYYRRDVAGYDRIPHNRWNGNLEQAWFPGVHCDVGGGEKEDGLANEALHWIVERAQACGLVVDESYLKYFHPCFNGKLHESMTPAYRLFGENIRPMCVIPGSEECIHQTAIDRSRHSDSRYAAPNLETSLKRASPKIVDTRRIPRGVACAPLPWRPTWPDERSPCFGVRL